MALSLIWVAKWREAPLYLSMIIVEIIHTSHEKKILILLVVQNVMEKNCGCDANKLYRVKV